MIKNAMARTAIKDSFRDGVYVELSKVEVPLSVKEALFNEHKRICPKNADITDDEIQEMVSEVRYGK
jgi:hypothetical protein